MTTYLVFAKKKNLLASNQVVDRNALVAQVSVVRRLPHGQVQGARLFFFFGLHYSRPYITASEGKKNGLSGQTVDERCEKQRST